MIGEAAKQSLLDGGEFRPESAAKKLSHLSSIERLAVKQGPEQARRPETPIPAVFIRRRQHGFSALRPVVR